MVKVVGSYFNKVKNIPVVQLIFGLAIVWFLNTKSQEIFEVFYRSSDPHIVETFFIVSLIFALSFFIFYTAKGVSTPSFVIAIFFGVAAKHLLEPATSNVVLLSELVGFSATLILFGGGLETPWDNFKKLITKILSLSFIGLFLTAILFSLAVYSLGLLFNTHIPITVSVLLGAVLASTDPAAIIPVLKQLRFNNRDTKDLIISESAVTDVTGTLLTVVFLSLILSGISFDSVLNGYTSLFTQATGVILIKQIVFGVMFGVVGYGFLKLFSIWKKDHEEEYEVDAAFFFFVPIIIFTLALALGGSGYLAAFITGLLFVLNEHLHLTEKFFNQTIEGFLKPLIFILLGSLVDINALIQYAPIGLSAAFIFMFIIRPLAVFITLGPFSFFGSSRFTWKELVFISFVRETGAIPAVLLVTVMSAGLVGMESLVPIGMWVILATLIVQPPLTPFIAKYLKVAEPITDENVIDIGKTQRPYIVLGSRGRSFMRRLEAVVEWADDHEVTKVMLLHCLEDKYTPSLASEIYNEAHKFFKDFNKRRLTDGKKKIEFSYMSRTGFLQNNIDEISKSLIKPTAIFVGKWVLDFRLDEIKRLESPLFFID